MDLARSVGFDDREGAAFGVETELPTAFVREVMVSAAEWQKIADVGATAVSPIADVMRCAVLEGDTASADGARLVHHPQSPPLVGRGEPLGPTEIEYDSVGAKDGGDDVGETCHPADGFNGERDASVNFNSGLRVRPVEQRLEINDNDQIGPTRPRTGALGELYQRKCA